MFRRRTPADRRLEPGPQSLRHTAGASGSPAPTAAHLAEAGWVLPRSLAAGTGPRWTLVGTVGSPTATAVDAGGLVQGDGWSLDWWIGADDRWHLPAREAAVRQRMVDDVPVVETALRIPGGDALHRAYGIRTPRAVGDEWVVVEVENATPVPFALAVVIRPFLADGVGDARRITLEKVKGGKGRDGAQLVRIDDVPAVVLPRLPARFAAGNLDTGDVLETVLSGAAGSEMIEATCADGLATLAMVFPLPHTAILRMAIPVGAGTGPGAVIDHPTGLPDAASVVSGWEVHRRGPRVEIPDRRLADALARARAHLNLAHDGAVVRRDGARSPSMDPGATDVILAAFDALDRPAEVDAVVARWSIPVDPAPAPTPEADAVLLAAVANHHLLHRSQPVVDHLLPEVAAAVERIGKAERRGRIVDPVSRARSARALDLASWMFAETRQVEAAAAVGDLASRLGSGPAVDPAADGDLVEQLLAAARAADHARLVALCAGLSATGAAPGPGPGGRPIGHDLAASAAVVLAVRGLLVAESREGLALLPQFPDDWYGGGIELHDAPTAHGKLSFAVRWHDSRPAVLWDLEPHPGRGPVRLTVPGLDPSWTTTETRGDALLAEVAPPAGLDRLRVVADHPDIDPAMRRPGTDPDPIGDGDVVGGGLPEGGSFS